MTSEQSRKLAIEKRQPTEQRQPTEWENVCTHHTFEDAASSKGHEAGGEGGGAEAIT